VPVSSAVEDRPADVVPQPLVVEHEIADRLRELRALPRALALSGSVALVFRHRRPGGLDRVRRRAEVVRGDVRDSSGLAGRVGGMPRRPAAPRRSLAAPMEWPPPPVPASW
jgi:hypothetical protein